MNPIGIALAFLVFWSLVAVGTFLLLTATGRLRRVGGRGGTQGDVVHMTAAGPLTRGPTAPGAAEWGGEADARTGRAVCHAGLPGDDSAHRRGGHVHRLLDQRRVLLTPSGATGHAIPGIGRCMVLEKEGELA